MKRPPIGERRLMLYHLLEPLFDQHIMFNLFRYITFRAAAGMGPRCSSRWCSVRP
jgi:hypothetical protein